MAALGKGDWIWVFLSAGDWLWVFLSVGTEGLLEGAGTQEDDRMDGCCAGAWGEKS